MADACEEWLICDLAAQSIGAIVYGIYPTASAEEVEYQMRDGGAVVFVAEDQEYVDKILPLANRLPALQHIVVVDETALFALAHDKLITFREVCEAGRDADLPAHLVEALLGLPLPQELEDHAPGFTSWVGRHRLSLNAKLDDFPPLS